MPKKVCQKRPPFAPPFFSYSSSQTEGTQWRVKSSRSGGGTGLRRRPIPEHRGSIRKGPRRPVVDPPPHQILLHQTHLMDLITQSTAVSASDRDMLPPLRGSVSGMETQNAALLQPFCCGVWLRSYAKLCADQA